MKRVIVTNNKKVENFYEGKTKVVMLNDASALEVLKEGEKVAEEGGKLMIDPTRRKGYYKSLIFLVEEESAAPHEKSLQLIKGCIEETSKSAGEAGKEPLLAGIHQNGDLNLVKSIMQ